MGNGVPCVMHSRAEHTATDPIRSHGEESLVKGEKGWELRMQTRWAESRRVKVSRKAYGKLRITSSAKHWNLLGPSVTTACKALCTHWQGEQPQEDQ